MHRVFVTGGTGFVGRALIQALRAEGHVVRCLVRRGSEHDLRGFEAIERVEGDVLARASLDEAMSGCDAVAHLVGIIREHPARGITVERLHVDATLNILAAATTVGVRRLLHMSALGARPDARARYHRTKWRAEEAVRSSGLDWTIFRPSIIYGPDDGFVTTLARVVRRLPVVPVIGSGNTRLQPVPVQTVAEGFARALDQAASVGQTYEVGGPDPHTLNEIIDLLGEILKRRKVRKVHVPFPLVRRLAVVLQGLPFFPVTTDQLLMLEEDNVCDPTPFYRAFGLSPVPLAKGLERMLVP
jgi:NADH dehydrogenase